jgi:hypothetical protein
MMSESVYTWVHRGGHNSQIAVPSCHLRSEHDIALKKNAAKVKFSSIMVNLM